LAGKAQRSKPTRSRPARPVQKRYPESRLEQLVLIGVGAILVIAAVVVLVGLFITQYLPPRAHVLTVEDHEYDAAQVEARGSYMLRFEQDFVRGVTQATLVDTTIDRIIRDEVLLRRAPAVVGDVTDDEVKQQLRIQLGFATPTPTPTPTLAPGATATPASSPTATPTATATPDEEQQQQQAEDFAKAQQDLYRVAAVSPSEYTNILKADLLQQRLEDKFKTEIGSSAPQIKLEMIRVADQPTAQRVHDQAVAGSDFVRLAAQYSTTATAKQDGGELGWQLVSTLDPQVRDAVQSLPAGGISEILQKDNNFEIYKVTEAQTSRDLSSTQLDTLLKQKVDAWFAQETPNVKVERDLSSGESDWLLNHIISDAQKRGVAATPTATPAGGTSNGQ
jgi:hypothetical protein